MNNDTCGCMKNYVKLENKKNIWSIKMFKRLSVLFALFALLFGFNAVANAAATASEKQTVAKEEVKNEPVTDLVKAYEVWKNKGIKFVIRDKKNGQFETWSVGRLESWGTKSKWVVRNKKGQFLTHATGHVENWKNGRSRLVLRDKKGRILTHIKLDLTDKGNFYTTAVGLRRLQNDTFLAFVQDSLGDILEEELKAGSLSKARALIAYLDKHKKDKGAENFKPVIRRMIPLMQALNSDGKNARAAQTVEAAGQLLKDLQ